jgi:hypothetical protein
MRFSSVDALFEAPPATQFAEQFEPARDWSPGQQKAPVNRWPGRGGSDTKLLCMRFCCRTGSTPRHPNMLSLIRYEYQEFSAASRRPRHFHDKHFLFRPQIKGIPKWLRSYASSTMIPSMDIRNPTPRRSPENRTLSRRSNAADAEGYRFQAGCIARQRVRRIGPPQIS